MASVEASGSTWNYRASTMLLLLGAMFLCLIYLMMRNFGLFLSVPDEWEYSEATRLIPISAVNLPSYLYFLIYRVADYCGNDFIHGVQLINGLFFVGAMPLIYMVARRVITRPVALFVAVITAIGPLNTYTAYFMPESLYFFSFWLLMCWVVCGPAIHSLRYGVIIGVIIGLMALVKAHAVFLVPAIAAFIVLRNLLSEGPRSLKDPAVAVIAFISAAALVRFGLGFAIGGRAGLSLFGAIYGSIAPSGADAGRYAQLAALTMVSIKGHMMAMACLFALPLAALFYFPPKVAGAKEAESTSRDVKLLTFLILACLIMVTAAFTAKVAGSNAFETVTRLHMRYYSFALPLLLIVAADLLNRSSGPVMRYRALMPAVIVGGLSIFALSNLLKAFTPGIVDSPELRGLAIQPMFFSVVVVAGLIALITWVLSPRRGAQLFLFVVVPFTVVYSGYNANVELRQNMQADSYAEAGIIAKHYIGKNLEPMIVVGADQSSLYRTLFYLDNVDAAPLVVPSEGRIDGASIPANARWLLVVGGQALPPSARKQLEFGGFVLARVGSEEKRQVDFTRGAWPGVIASVKGLSSPEPWGTWSDGNKVVLEFSKPLPEQFTLLLKARSLGDTSQPVTLTVGSEQREVRFPKPQELALPFSTNGEVTSIAIDIPWARSPKDMGISADPRRLGIGFESIQVVFKVPAYEP